MDICKKKLQWSKFKNLILLQKNMLYTNENT